MTFESENGDWCGPRSAGSSVLWTDLTLSCQQAHNIMHCEVKHQRQRRLAVRRRVLCGLIVKIFFTSLHFVQSAGGVFFKTTCPKSVRSLRCAVEVFVKTTCERSARNELSVSHGIRCKQHPGLSGSGELGFNSGEWWRRGWRRQCGRVTDRGEWDLSSLNSSLVDMTRHWWSPKGETFVTTLSISLYYWNIVLSKSTRVLGWHGQTMPTLNYVSFLSCFRI